MDFLKKNRSLIVAVVVFAIALWAYGTFFQDSDTGISTDQSAQKVGGDVLDLYASLQSVTLDQTLFSTALYRHLVDFSGTIPLQPQGRTNPFGVIGND